MSTLSDMASVKAVVDPQLLIWARRTANLEPLAANRKINVPEGRVEQWESGERAPTIAELRRAGEVYNRALGVFFLPGPPEGFDTLRDFRRVDFRQTSEWSVDLHVEYRRAHDQRDALLEIVELDNKPASRAWRITVFDDDARIARLARELLEQHGPMPYPRPSADQYAHLGYWIAALESVGVMVMQSTGGRVSTDEMRAFSLYFDDIPVIVLNGADFPRGRTFSLIHEYAHLLLHTAGLCDTRTDQRALTDDRLLEARCNTIAADLLMPAAAIFEANLVATHSVGVPWTLSELIEAARPFGVSAESFLRRLVTLGLVPIVQYQQFRDDNRGDHIERLKPGGGNFYITKARDLGKGYVRTVTGAHRRALIDSTTAATYLGVKVGQIAELAARARL
jgi:Zn-dependent peptidase ImmA (M78 family)